MLTWTVLPPELWVCIFEHATCVPGTLVPDVYAYASLTGSVCAKAPLRDALLTKRAIVRVCKQWWHLATPFLYKSVYIGRRRSLFSLPNTLANSIAGSGTLVSTRPLGEYTQRLDIALRDHSQDPDTPELDTLPALIRCMPHLTVVSFANFPSYFGRPDCADAILIALEHSASSLHVLDWCPSLFEPSTSQMMGFLDKCTQLRILHCYQLVWSKELQHGGIPPTVTTLRLHALTQPAHLPHLDSTILARPVPSALEELALTLDSDIGLWKDLLRVYGVQLVSVQLFVPDNHSINVGSHLQLLVQTCPRLRRLTITSDLFFCGRPLLDFPSITYLGLRATQSQSPRAVFVTLLAFLEGLPSRVPSLRVVRLLNEKHVRCLLKSHTKLATRALKLFMDNEPFRVEDHEGVLLTDRLKALGHL